MTKHSGAAASKRLSRPSPEEDAVCSGCPSSVKGAKLTLRLVPPPQCSGLLEDRRADLLPASSGCCGESGAWRAGAMSPLSPGTALVASTAGLLLSHLQYNHTVEPRFVKIVAGEGARHRAVRGGAADECEGAREAEQAGHRRGGSSIAPRGTPIGRTV